MDKQAAIKWLEDTASDAMMDVFYYDRKEDEDMLVDRLEKLVASGIITEQDAINAFTKAIKEAFND